MPAWQACGCAMDVLRSCYASKMRIFPDRPDIEVEGEWRWCPPDAKVIPYGIPWSSCNWDEATHAFADEQLGEIARGEYSKGILSPRLNGQHFCGTQDEWENGTPYNERGKVPVDVDNVPLCCKPIGAIVAGDVDDGEATQVVMLPITGDVDDGQAYQWVDPYLVGEEGDADDGEATQEIVNPTIAIWGCDAVPMVLPVVLVATPSGCLNGVTLDVTWDGTNFVGNASACGGQTVTVTLSDFFGAPISQVCCNEVCTAFVSGTDVICEPFFVAFGFTPVSLGECGDYELLTVLVGSV